MNNIIFTTILMLSVFGIIACEKIFPSAPSNDEILDGNVEGLTHEQLRQHKLGDDAFNNEIFSSQTGLGPIFVATSCGSCHAGDGKGTPFTTLVRFGQFDSTGNRFLAQGGPQLQNRALPGFKPESIPQGATFAKFTPPSTTGLGYLELVSDEDILALADPGDADDDGISGTPNWNHLPSYIMPSSNSISQNGKYICRFGKKASVFGLIQQVVLAYNQDIGITSAYEPIDVYSGHEFDPEVSGSVISSVVFYLQTLKAPLTRNQNEPTVIQGKKIFIEIGCNGCHKESLKTGYSPINALSNKEFHPYTDLLLHDMGPELDDGYTEGSAKTYEWRTAPLWGLGLSPKSQGGRYFLMHDGRANSIEGAINLHGGEAARSRSNFQQLKSQQRDALIKFLESL